MKKFMIMCMMLLAATLTFTACGDDDDDNNGGNNNQQQQEQNEVNQDNYYKYQETVEVKGAGKITLRGEAWFENGKCTKVQYSYVLPSKAAAKASYEQFEDDDEWANVYYDGDKTITVTETQEEIATYATMDKAMVCELVKTIVKGMAEAMVNPGAK